MKFKTLKKYAKLSFVVFNFLVLLTLFLPFVSIDRYTEYEFSGGYYSEEYTSFTTPKATRIKPITIIKSLFTKRNDLYESKAEYIRVKSNLTEKFLSGEISEEKYNKLLASHPATSEYTFFSIKFADDDELSRLQSKIFLYSVIVLVFYVVCAINFIINLINLFSSKKFLGIVNIFCGWILTILLLVFNIYTFSLAVSFDNQISGFSGKIMEKVTTCMSPKTLPLLLLVALIIYSVLATLFDKKISQEEKQNKEIPVVVSASLGTKNKYRKIYSKKSKYKNGSKKKRNK